MAPNQGLRSCALRVGGRPSAAGACQLPQGDPALLGAQADGRRSVPGSSRGWRDGCRGCAALAPGAFMEVTRGCPLCDEGHGEEVLGYPRVSGTDVGYGNLRRGTGVSSSRP